VWRIGLMGYASSRKNVLFCLGALEAVLNRSGGVAEARAYYSTL
jgi:aspartate aminotransferase-like enzyme